MKRFIASDIHGSRYYCQKLLALYRREGAEELILLGDLAYSGSYDPRYQYDPAGVIAMLNPLAKQILCVAGNCDWGIEELAPQFPLVSRYALVQWDGREGVVTHGHQMSPQNPPPRGMANFLLSGHTHVPAAEQVGDLLCLNPGSVSLPRRGSPHCCLIYEGHCFRWVTLDGTELDRRTLP